MNTLVIDASVAVKWVVEEEGTDEALALRATAKFIAPDLLVAECANILWKKVRRGELLPDEASFGARLLQASDVELLPMRPMLENAIRMAVELNHPAYDCLYLELAIRHGCRLVTADERLLKRLGQTTNFNHRDRAILLKDAAR